MPVLVDPQEFLQITRPLLRQGDAQALAQAVQVRWRARDLCPLLQHPDEDVRKVVAMTLGLVGDRGAINCLARALRDKVEQVSAMAEHALRAIWVRSGAPRALGPFQDGVALLRAEGYERAITCFEAAAALDPSFAEAHHQCGIAYCCIADYPRALECMRRAVRLMPVHFDALASQGCCHGHLDQLDLALACYQQAYRINPRLQALPAIMAQTTAALRRRNDASGVFSLTAVR